ncbi:lipocalin family protein [Streptomyces sp. ZAF1911]|uniref:lipocalin family protein n=1 Tax=Streptomyces sp. ZAF1911 TaxID=2944129 RepID=UPI00237B8E81|nr:lipocalin family protein [Streptomyces sp. ZAF1911]MDD9376906.1 lipocalin family protein [Streptomyces sp. ZAF1911]
MTMLSRRRLLTIGAPVAAAAVLCTTVLTTAQADESHSSAAAGTTAGTGIPASVNASTDLASQGAKGKSDSIYFTSQVKSKGHTFGILVHTVNAVEADQRIMSVAVTDETTGWYKNYQVPVAKDDYTWSTEGLNIKMPGLTWTGDAKQMSVQASTPWGALDLDFETKGPAMNYAGTGEFDMLGKRQYEFALPAMRTTGTLTLEGQTHKVSGESWLDRQWGELPLGASNHWTWMNLSLSNGDKVAIWDAVGNKEENSWATVLHPDGSYELAAVKPLADSADKFWTSPTSGQSYPTRWRVQIPSLKADLNVRVTGTKGQEIGAGQLSRFEGTATTTGIYKGKPVTGHNFVEMVGNWSK